MSGSVLSEVKQTHSMFGNCCLLDLCNAIAFVDQIAAADPKAQPKRLAVKILKAVCGLKAGGAGSAMCVQWVPSSQLWLYVMQRH